jgi:hypothetical protein
MSGTGDNSTKRGPAHDISTENALRMSRAALRESRRMLVETEHLVTKHDRNSGKQG